MPHTCRAYAFRYLYSSSPCYAVLYPFLPSALPTATYACLPATSSRFLPYAFTTGSTYAPGYATAILWFLCYTAWTARQFFFAELRYLTYTSPYHLTTYRALTVVLYTFFLYRLFCWTLLDCAACCPYHKGSGYTCFLRLATRHYLPFLTLFSYSTCMPYMVGSLPSFLAPAAGYLQRNALLRLPACYTADMLARTARIRTLCRSLLPAAIRVYRSTYTYFSTYRFAHVSRGIRCLRAYARQTLPLA